MYHEQKNLMSQYHSLKPVIFCQFTYEFMNITPVMSVAFTILYDNGWKNNICYEEKKKEEWVENVNRKEDIMQKREF